VLSKGSRGSCGQGPNPVTVSGLQPASMRVSGHSQLPVTGLKANPGSQGIPVAVTREQTPGGIIPNAGGGGPNNCCESSEFRLNSFWSSSDSC